MPLIQYSSSNYYPGFIPVNFTFLEDIPEKNAKFVTIQVNNQFMEFYPVAILYKDCLLFFSKFKGTDEWIKDLYKGEFQETKGKVYLHGNYGPLDGKNDKEIKNCLIEFFDEFCKVYQ